jgi:hypothetical protein
MNSFSVLIPAGFGTDSNEPEKEGIGLFDTGHFVDFVDLDSESGKFFRRQIWHYRRELVF